MTRTARDAEATRSSILQAALDAFAEHGLSGARVDAIAAASGTNVRMIYYYFASKEGLYLAVLEQCYTAMRKAEAALGLGALAPESAITALTGFVFDYHEAEPRLARLVSIENIHRAAFARRLNSLRALNDGLIATLADILKRGQREGLFRADVTPLGVHLLMTSFCFFRVANRDTLDNAFGQDPLAAELRDSHRRMIIDAVLGFLRGNTYPCMLSASCEPSEVFSRRIDCAGRADRLTGARQSDRADRQTTWCPGNQRVQGTIRMEPTGHSGGLAVPSDTGGQSASAHPAQDAALFQLLVENSTDLIVRTDAELNRDFISAAVRSILGYDPAELMGRSALELVHPDDRDRVQQTLARLGLEHSDLGCVFRMRHRDGGHVWMEGRYRYLTETGGMVSIARDISRQKQAESRFAEAKGRLESVNLLLQTTLEHVGQGVCFFDGDRRLLLCNQQYAELYRLSPEALSPGTSLEEIVAMRTQMQTGPAMGPQNYLTWRYGLSAAAPFDADVTLEDGRVIHVVHRPMEGGGWVATHEDVTERRHGEEMVVQARKLEAIGRLTGGMAHDFNNLLQTVGTALEMSSLVMGAQADAELRQLLADAAQSVRQGGALTQQLLAFSRRQMLLVTRVDLWQLVLESEQLLRQICADQVRLELGAAPPPLPCALDPAQFRGSLVNLALNACEAMPGGGTLTLRVDMVTLTPPQAARLNIGAGTFARLDVVDTGHGIAESDLPHVFEPFFTTKTVSSSAGLGLAQVHGFAHQSGGSVSIRSGALSGTVVSLLLPLADALPQMGA